VAGPDIRGRLAWSAGEAPGPSQGLARLARRAAGSVNPR